MLLSVEIAWIDLQLVRSARLSLAHIVSLNSGVAIPLRAPPLMELQMGVNPWL